METIKEAESGHHNAGLHNLGGISRTVVTWLYVNAAVNVFGAISAALLYLVMQNSKDSQLLVLLSTATELMVGLAQLVCMIVCAVFFCKWIFRAYSNLETMRVPGLSTTAKMAVWYWFIPILYLWKPYYATRDVWQASDPQAQGSTWLLSDIPKMFGLWWTLWLLQAAVAQAAARLSMKSDEIGLLATSLDVISEILCVGAALTAVRIVKQSTDRHTEKVAKFTAAAAPAG